ncbi:thermonuclease family protein [Chelatococcus sp. GCM10030263]|uniref:thermonuclease family protein n=1 Tax=Chelatococcus sp. GCM10030263 TaxID=3273387 RepID=UPI003618D863
MGNSDRPDPQLTPEQARRRRTAVLVLIAAALAGVVLALGGKRTWAGEFDRPPIIAIDGDTLVVGGEHIRIIGLDAPETYQAHCSAELRLGQRATNYMRSMVPGGIDIQRTDKRDRYGRSLAHVYFHGEDVAAIMVRHGLAVPYVCGRHCGRRIDWCAKLGRRQS